MQEKTKLIVVTESYSTHLEVSPNFSLKDGDDAIRSLLTNSMPLEGHDQRPELLLITDFDTGEQIHFNKEKL